MLHGKHTSARAHRANVKHEHLTLGQLGHLCECMCVKDFRLFLDVASHLKSPFPYPVRLPQCFQCWIAEGGDTPSNVIKGVVCLDTTDSRWQLTGEYNGAFH
jgi:hypothetical protein